MTGTERIFGDLGVDSAAAPGVALMEIRRPPTNHFNVALIASIADAVEWLDGLDEVRALVLAAQGRHFCAGGDFSTGSDNYGNPLDGDAAVRINPLYTQAVRLFGGRKPMVAAVQGAAVGGGLGLALACDFRVASESARFVGNFANLGITQGFGVSATLPRAVGQQQAAMMLYTGRRVKGGEAHEMGLVDVYTGEEDPRPAALALAQEIADNAPLAVEAIRAILRKGLQEQVRAAVEREFLEQRWLSQTKDHAEGVKAVADRRKGDFQRA